MRMGTVRRTSATGLALVLLSCSTRAALAQPERDDETEASESGLIKAGGSASGSPGAADDAAGAGIAEAQRQALRPRYSIDTEFDATLDASLDGGGDLSVYRSNLNASVLIPQEDRSAFSLSLRGTRTFYNWSDPASLDLPSDEQPFQRINEVAISGSYMRPLTDHWSGFVAGRLDYAAEDGATLGDGLTVGTIGAVEYRFDNDLRLSGGVILSTRLEEDILPIPFVAVNWQINEQWSLTNDNALGLQVRYAPNEQWRFALGAEYARDEFRLDDSGFAPDGAAKRIRVPLRFETVWTPHPRVTLSGEVGADLLHRVQISDSNGVRRREFAADPSLAVGAMLTFRF
ncbi:MAG: DUF6268 family outer membrane beta-barrel protein [Planctomycetota bacterium]